MLVELVEFLLHVDVDLQRFAVCINDQLLTDQNGLLYGASVVG